MDPALMLKVPAGQLIQTVEPPADWYVPVGQLTQALTSVDPVFVSYVPAGQLMQAVEDPED